MGTTPYGFAGEWNDATGLEYLRARYYSAAQGRFVSRDVWPGDHQRPQSLNGWSYAEGNPVLYTDASGQCIDCTPLPELLRGILSALGLCLTPTPTPEPVQPGPPPPGATPPPPATPVVPPSPTAVPTASTPGQEDYELAEMMYWEERSQGEQPMIAAGWVAVNRRGQARDDGSGKSFPATLLEVLKESSQFQGYVANSSKDVAAEVLNKDKDDPNKVAWGLARADAPRIIQKQISDITGGAKYFGNGVGSEMETCKANVTAFVSQQIGSSTMFVSNKPYTYCPAPTATPKPR